MIDGVQQAEQRPGTLSLTEHGKRPGRPDGGMGVLPAIFAHTRRIALDVTGVVGRFVKGRCKQQDQLIGLPDQQAIDGFHRLGRPQRIGGLR